jgi:hypothetical protein
MFHARDCAWLAVAWMLFPALPASAQSPAKPPDPKTIAGLISQLGSENFQERQAATRSLEEIGRPALAALREAVDKNTNAEVTRRAKGLIEKIDNGLEQLLEDYKSYGLPLPPKDAPLVRFTSDGGRANGGRLPEIYSLGFLVKADTKWETAKILMGPRPSVWGSKGHTILDDPAKAKPQEIEAWAEDAREAWLLLAIQCKSRGWDALAQAIFKKGARDSADGGFRSAVRRQAWDYWMAELLGQKSDWKLTAKHLNALIDADPAFDTLQNRALLKSLDLALLPSTAKPGSIEAMIDGLVNATSISAYYHEESDANFVRLIEKGFEAVPELIQHLDDNRLTRHTCHGFNNFRSYQCRVGHLVSYLLEGLAGKDLGGDGLRAARGNMASKDRAQTWWESAQKDGEQGYLLGHVLPRGKVWPNEYMLRVLAKKHSHRLPEVYRTLMNKQPKMQSWPVADALATSDVPREQKIELYAYAGRHPNLEHRRAAFKQLQALDRDRFMQLLVETLNGLPATPAEPYWLCCESSFAYLVAGTDAPAAWEALEKATKRADPGLRMEILKIVSYAGEGKQRKQRLAFLAKFLDDTTVRDVHSDPKRFQGPYAEGDFNRLEVRNGAAMQIARILELGKKPLPTWNDEQWQRFRDEVRQALKP